MTRAQSRGDTFDATPVCRPGGVWPANCIGAWMSRQSKWNQDWSKVHLTERQDDETAARSRQRPVYISLEPPFTPSHHRASQPLLVFLKRCTSVRRWGGCEKSVRGAALSEAVLLSRLRDVKNVGGNGDRVWTSPMTELESSRCRVAAGGHTTGRNSIWQRDSTFTLVTPQDDFNKETTQLSSTPSNRHDIT